MTDSVFSTHAGCAGAHEAEGYPAEWSCITSVSGDGSQAQQSTCSTDEVYPFGHTRSQCGKKGATVWGQEAPEQLTPRFSQPCPQHTFAEGFSVSGYDMVTHFPPPQLTACPQAHQSHLGLDLPHPNNTLARHLPQGRGRSLGGWPRGPEKEHELPRSALRYPNPQDRRTRQARALTTFRDKEKNLMSLTQHFLIIPHKGTYLQSRSASVTGQNCPHPSLYFTPLTLPITSLPKHRASPRMKDKLKRNRRELESTGLIPPQFTPSPATILNFPEASWAEEEGH